MTTTPPPAYARPWVIAIVCASLGVVVAASILLNFPTPIAIVALVTAAAYLAAVSWNDWRFGIVAFFAWFAIEDLVRKFTGNALVVYAGKDLIYLAALAGFARDAWTMRAPLFRQRLVLLPVAALVAWALLLSAPSLHQSLLLPIVGLRGWFFYVPMVFLGYAAVVKDRSWRAFVVTSLIVGAFVAVVGLSQTGLGLNLFNPTDEHGLPLTIVHSFGGNAGVPRPNSVFLHAGRFSAYVFVVLFAGIAAIAFARSLRPWARIALAFAWVLVLAAALLGGQRVTLPLLGLGIVTATIMAVRGGADPAARRRRMTVVAAGGAALVLVLAGISLVNPRTADLIFRFYQATFVSSGISTVASQTSYSWRNIPIALHSSWMGHGTGTTSLGKQYIFGSDINAAGLFDTEGGYAAIAWEWGIVGLVLWLTMTVTLIAVMVRRMRPSVTRGPHAPFLGGVLVATFSILFPWFLLSGQNYQDYVTQSYLWFLVGAFFALTEPGVAVHPIAPEGTPKRIAVVTPFLDLKHGTERCIAEQINLLGNDGVEVHVYAQRVADVEVVRWKRGMVIPKGTIVWHRVPRIRLFGLLDYAFWFAAQGMQRAWDRRAHKLVPDIVLSPGVNCLDADAIVVHIVFAEYVRLARRDLSLRTAPVRAWPRLLHRRLYYAVVILLESRVYRAPGVRLGAVSKLTAEELRRHYGREDVTVVPNAVNGDVFNPQARTTARAQARARFGFAPDDIVIALVGNDWKKKGLGTLLQAVARAGDTRVRVLVRGRDDRALYDREIARLGLSDRVVFDPPASEVLPVFAAADIYVGPSVHDSFALPPLEAMACGLPVITSVQNGGSQAITSGHDGFVLADPQDAESLARIILELAQDPKGRELVGLAASAKARSYTWARSTDALRSVLSPVAFEVIS